MAAALAPTSAGTAETWGDAPNAGPRTRQRWPTRAKARPERGRHKAGKHGGRHKASRQPAQAPPGQCRCRTRQPQASGQRRLQRCGQPSGLKVAGPGHPQWLPGSCPAVLTFDAGASTGHVGITNWPQCGLPPFSVFSSRRTWVNGVWAGSGCDNKGGSPVLSFGIAQPCGSVFAQFMHASCARCLNSSPCRGWRDRSVLSCQPWSSYCARPMGEDRDRDSGSAPSFVHPGRRPMRTGQNKLIPVIAVRMPRMRPAPRPESRAADRRTAAQGVCVALTAIEIADNATGRPGCWPTITG